MWYRVFAAIDHLLPPADLLAFLQERGHEATGHFRGDDDGWFSAEIIEAPSELRLDIQRYLASEEGVRRDLNTWAAWIEDALGEEKGGPWMQWLITARQVITLRLADEEAEWDDDADRLLTTLCQYFSGLTHGLYQVDGKGLFKADGAEIAKETL